LCIFSPAHFCGGWKPTVSFIATAKTSYTAGTLCAIGPKIGRKIYEKNTKKHLTKERFYGYNLDMFEFFIKYVGKNFRNPNGIGGKILTKLMNILAQKQYNAVLENICLNQNDVILEVGFANGYLIKKLFNKNIPVNIYGIDISNDMVKNVTIINKHYIENGQLKLSVENINKTSFGEKTFDKIYTVNTIYFWDNMDKCLTEIKRILKTGGIFINVFHTKEYLDKIIYTKHGFQKYTAEQIEKSTKDNGLEVIKKIEIIKDKTYCIISRK
jgi:SAM-dependent methyltransferase